MLNLVDERWGKSANPAEGSKSARKPDKEMDGAPVRPPYHACAIQGAVAFADVAKRARLEHIMSLPQWLASPSHPS